MDDRLQYLALMAGCVLITLPLEFVLAARIYRRPRALLFAMLPMLVVFTAWDLLGIVRGHWWYSERFTTGWHVGLVPVEELVFFVVVPLCGLLTYGAVGTVLGYVKTLRAWKDRGRA